MGLLDGKIAVVTGAGSGMAKASVKVFVREGAKVVAGDISGAENDTAAEVGHDVLPVHCDVTKEEDVAAMFKTAEEEHGRVDVALNVAGIGIGGLIQDLDVETYFKETNVDLLGVMLGMKHAFRAFLKQGGGGAVVNWSSAAVSMRRLAAAPTPRPNMAWSVPRRPPPSREARTAFGSTPFARASS